MPRAALHPITVAAGILLMVAAPTATQMAAGTGVVEAAARTLASAAPDDFHVTAACAANGPAREVRIFGHGVGIWNRSSQFTVTRDLLDAVIEVFRTADFEHMPAVFGGTVGADGARRGPRIICQVGLAAGTLAREVVQLEKGTQSKALWTLANTILDLSEKPAASGITAASLEDGLAGIAAGRLAPETLELTVHHRPAGTGGRARSGWILHVEGGAARVDDYDESTTPRRRVGLRLAAGELRELVRALQEQQVTALPGNVYAAGYTDVHVGVLDRDRQVQAREFAGLSAAARTRGRAQFERLLTAFDALHRRVAETGQPVP